MTTDAECMHEHLRGLAEVVDAMTKNLPAAQQYASTPEGRQKAIDLQRLVREQLADLRAGVRQMEKADRVITKVLRKPWGIAL